MGVIASRQLMAESGLCGLDWRCHDIEISRIPDAHRMSILNESVQKRCATPNCSAIHTEPPNYISDLSLPEFHEMKCRLDDPAAFHSVSHKYMRPIDSTSTTLEVPIQIRMDFPCKPYSAESQFVLNQILVAMNLSPSFSLTRNDSE